MRQNIFERVSRHRDNMDNRWGVKSIKWQHNPHEVLSLLMEEVGEVARGVIENDEAQIEDELYDVIQICVAWLESMEV